MKMNCVKHKSKRGLNVPVKGIPTQKIHTIYNVNSVAIVADDYPGMRPRMFVKVGDIVKIGQPLFTDRKNASIVFTSPGAGKIAQINRGAKRALISVVVELQPDPGKELQPDPSKELQPDPGKEQEIAYQSFEEFKGKDAKDLDAKDIITLLQESGLWTSVRQRPFGNIASSEFNPHALFITASDTNPLAPNPDVIIANQLTNFKIGVEVLSKLAPKGHTYVCFSANSTYVNKDDDANSESNLEFKDAQLHSFKGPHPSGNVGYHIHVIDPVDLKRTAWHVGYQDVIAVGHLISTGKQLLKRWITIGGPSALNPRLIETRIGASMLDLLSKEISNKEPVKPRIISGSILNGRDCEDERVAFVGRFHNQITLLSQGNKRKFLGWLAPGWNSYSASKLFLSSLNPSSGKDGKSFDLDTSNNGGLRAIVPSSVLDKMMPFELLPHFLLRSLVAADLEQAQELGCLEIDEEDLALCTLTCPSKIDYGAALRNVLDKIKGEIN